MKCVKQFICLHCADREGECPDQVICRFTKPESEIKKGKIKSGKVKKSPSANPYSRNEIAEARKYLSQVRRHNRMSPAQIAAFDATNGIRYRALSYEQCEQLMRMVKELKAKSRLGHVA